MGNKTEDRWRRAKANKTVKRHKHQKTRRLELLFEKIRGRCATCGKLKVQVGKKRYACPDEQKHIQEKEQVQEG